MSAQLALSWPEAPAAPEAPRDEQWVLPIPGTLAASYGAWRDSEQGESVVRLMAYLALREVGAGATRVGIKWLGEEVRKRAKVKVNNSHLALIARELKMAHPDRLGRAIHCRVRRAT